METQWTSVEGVSGDEGVPPPVKTSDERNREQGGSIINT